MKTQEEQKTNKVPKTQKSTPWQFLTGIRIALFFLVSPLKEMQGKISYGCTL